MKKPSIFVKFFNTMDHGGLGKEENNIKVDNIICRTSTCHVLEYNNHPQQSKRCYLSLLSSARSGRVLQAAFYMQSAIITGYRHRYRIPAIVTSLIAGILYRDG
ncbi:hypothetical protein BU16DRAFT_545201 [Lophium mytilinum]|uniref:Uncharacterized protein n=1 Tax=Lophium mytilinum TaxID=390894 RepID=A0A6A6QBB3_9PEZI|nr:hypothetical protein BU16DRAFT_545201 [Lophium mytilinum]